MVKSPGDKIDKDDYNDPAEYIRDALDEGWTMEASDFEGRPCSYCNRTIPFHEFMQNPDEELVTWDIPIRELDEDTHEAVRRFYFCHPQCRFLAKRDEEWLNGPGCYDDGDRIENEKVGAMR